MQIRKLKTSLVLNFLSSWRQQFAQSTRQWQWDFFGRPICVRGGFRSRAACPLFWFTLFVTRIVALFGSWRPGVGVGPWAQGLGGYGASASALVRSYTAGAPGL
eukprot:1161837-Alexandrium_andersonii.AAC.1